MRERVNDDFGRQEEFYIISKVQFSTIKWVNSCIKPLTINFEITFLLPVSVCEITTISRDNIYFNLSGKLQNTL